MSDLVLYPRFKFASGILSCGRRAYQISGDCTVRALEYATSHCKLERACMRPATPKKGWLKNQPAFFPVFIPVKRCIEPVA